MPGPYRLALLAVLAIPAVQAEERDRAGTFSFTLENDLFGGTDKYYTSGFQFTWRSMAYDPPSWLSWLGNTTSQLLPAGQRQRWGLAFGQNIFTPTDTQLRYADPNDRPYAGWLYGGISFTSYSDHEYGTFELQFGVIGPSALGEQVQNNVHDWINVDRALGWDAQLKDEPGINATLTHQWRINRPFDAADPQGLAFGIVPTLTASVGNVQTFASAGAMVRIGKNLDSDFGLPRLRPAVGGSAFFEPDGEWGWYVFGGLDGRAIAHDIFLDGNTWRDSRSVDKKHFVADASLGAVLILPWTRLSYVHTFRTKEFEGQYKPAQYGSISIAFRF